VGEDCVDGPDGGCHLVGVKYAADAHDAVAREG
jgi:hypothetical protein